MTLGEIMEHYNSRERINLLKKPWHKVLFFVCYLTIWSAGCMKIDQAMHEGQWGYGGQSP